MALRFQQVCGPCQVLCMRPQEWQRHVLTKKHLAAVAEKPFACLTCSRTYKHRAGLWRHQRACATATLSETATATATACSSASDSASAQTTEAAPTTLTDLVMTVVKSNAELQRQNQELQQQVLDICKKVASESGDHSVTTNSHNKTFNLNFFLNEECKNAMNLSEFVESFKVQLSDLEHVGKVGYVSGIAHLITQRLRAMDIYQRPIHCSDLKRDILHVKERNMWEKDTPDFAKLRHAVKHISNKNAKLLMEWRALHPESSNSDHKDNDVFLELVVHALGGGVENENKIIGRILKEIVIVK